jgi:hypothetical protein
VVSTTPQPLYPPDRPGIHCAGCWISLGGRYEPARKMSPARGFDPRTMQLVASRYVDCAFILFCFLLRRLKTYFLIRHFKFIKYNFPPPHPDPQELHRCLICIGESQLYLIVRANVRDVSPHQFTCLVSAIINYVRQSES